MCFSWLHLCLLLSTSLLRYLFYFFRLPSAICPGRPEGESCLSVDHCRASLQAQLAALKDKIQAGTADDNSGGGGGESDADLVNQLEAQLEQVSYKLIL